MINVNDETIKAYTEYGCDKKVTISFPGTNISAITNKNFQEESMKLTSGICEESTLQVGGCNATQFEITTFDIQTDLTNKDIVVSLSVKDESYKGDWNYDSEYVEGDIVKFNNRYFQYFSTPPSSDSGKGRRESISYSQWERSDVPTINLRTIMSPIFNKSDWLTRFRFESSEPPEGTSIILVVTFDDGRTPARITIDSTYFYRDINILDLADLFPEKAGYSIVAWNISITRKETADSEVDKWFEQSVFYVWKNVPINKLYPIYLSDYCQEIYGYFDTSETKDFIIFRGKINSFEKQTDPRYRTLIAYDKLYEVENVSITGWINAVNSYGEGYIEKYNYRGLWNVDLAMNYKKDDAVSFFESDGGLGMVQKYYFYLRDMNWRPFAGIAPNNLAVNKYPMQNGEVIPKLDNGDGNSYIQQLSGYYPNRVTVRKLRDDLCSHLGIIQENMTLPLDNVQLTIGEFKEDVSGAQLLKWICNLNMVFGYIVPETGKLRYASVNKEKKNVSEDANYKGEFSPGKSYEVNDVVSVVEDSGVTYYKNVCSLSNKVPTSFVSSDVKNTFMNISSKIKYFPPTKRGDDWYIHFDFDEELAQELDVTISVSPYNQTGRESVILRSPGNVYLPSVAGDGNFTIMVSNINDEFWGTFEAIIYRANGGSACDYEPYDAVVADFWEQCSPLYHPSGRINLSSIYDAESVILKDNKFRNRGYKVVDTSNNLVPEDNTNDVENVYLNIIYSPLYSAWKSTYDVYKDVSENVYHYYGAFTIEYTPFSLSSLGLPFLEPGDYVCFDVMEWSSDENDNPVITTKTVESIVLSRELSGINALMDAYEAKHE